MDALLATSSTATSPQSFAASFFSNLFGQITAWLADAGNGIHDLYAAVIHTNELCITKSDGSPVCVTGDQLAALLASENQSPSSGGSSQTSQSDDASSTPDTPPIIQINGDNPAFIQVGDAYNDLGATITGPQADLNLGIQLFLNSAPVDAIQLDTSQAATDTIDYVAIDGSGLTATSTRTVIVEAPSSPPPASNDNAATSSAAG